MIRFSNETAVLLCVVALLATAGTASDSLSRRRGANRECRRRRGVGDVHDRRPVTDAPNEWTLAGSTELQNVTGRSRVACGESGESRNLRD
ncbi:hypothetical protein C8039_17070 [Halogeometricum sp. wsp3]|nr:hypothetical protein C8039_17070 [Halogeometricum sp. wsp3]